MIHKFKTMIDGGRHNTQRRLWLNNGAISVLNSLGSSICRSVQRSNQMSEQQTTDPGSTMNPIVNSELAGNIPMAMNILI